MVGYFRQLVLWIALLLSGVAGAARVDVLVVVNENSVDSVQLGEYYAARRDIDPSRVVRVRVPNQFFISWTEFQSLRDQILRFGICPAVEAELRPPACDNPAAPLYTAETIAALTASTPIRYVVLTRGVPTRMRVDGSQLYAPNEPTSVDNYLRFWLARHLTQDVHLNFAERSDALNILDLGEWRRTLRSVNPPVDAEYIIGRIDGVDLTSAKALVDRTLAAESVGPYGKVQTDQSQVYPWRYAFGLFDEARPECADDSQSTHYLKYAQNTTQGKAPTHCTVQAVKSGTGVNELMPGVAGSRQPLVDDALVYFGDLDGQTVQGGFETLLNWRKTRSCSVTLCSAAADPAACRAQSTDPFREINTACVGVAPAFMGFNHVSYPVANLGSWPTGWEVVSYNENDVPRVDATRGADDSFSAWFDRADEVATPLCYPYAGGVLGTSTVACRAKTYIGMRQSLSVAGIDPAAPSPLQLSFRVLGERLTAAVSVRASLLYYFQVPASGSCPAGTTPSPAIAPTQCIYSGNNSFTVNNGSAWSTHSVTVTPVAVAGSPRLEQLLLQFVANSHVGSIGFDAISVRSQANVELVRNGTFADGHRQASAGDFAANFLSRLGGIAFWGSSSHHESAGHSFAGNATRSLAFLMRGLPLGDAVWLGETRNSGLLYGDPLYSPTAIRFFGLSDPNSRLTSDTTLWANSIYGRDLGSRHVRVSVCRGGDLYANPQSAGALRCDRNGGWYVLPGSEATVNGNGRQRYTLSPEEPVFTEYGNYTLRLQVTRVNPATGVSQTLDDYYPIKYRYSDAELAAYSIGGRVVTAGGDPIASASVSASSNGGIVRSVLSDLDGKFELFSLPAGTYQITVAAAGCVATPVNTTLPVTLTNQGARVDFQCELGGSGKLFGKATDPAGKAITNALVTVAQVGGGSTSAITTTSSTGYYQVGGLPPGTYSVNASLPGWSFAPRQAVLDASNPTSVNLRGIAAEGKVRGYVRDASGQAIAAAEVYGVASDESETIGTVTNSEGYFELGGLIATEYSINAAAPQFDSMPADMVVQRDATPVTITLSSRPASRSMMGFVVSNGVAVGSAVVTLTLPDGTEVTALTSPGGFYRFDNLHDGAYRVRAHGYGGSYGQRTVTISRGNAINVDFPAY